MDKILHHTLRYSYKSIRPDHRLRGSVSTVITITSKVNGKTEILTPCKSETPENRLLLKPMPSVSVLLKLDTADNFDASSCRFQMQEAHDVSCRPRSSK